MEFLKPAATALFLIAFLIGYIKWKLCAAVFAAWISENGYASPTNEDIKRLIKWVVHMRVKDVMNHYRPDS